jgi:hypothetical protein
VGIIASSHVIHWLGERRSILLFLAGCGVSLAVIGVGATVFSSFGVALLGYALYGFTSGICDVAMNVSGAGPSGPTAATSCPGSTPAGVSAPSPVPPSARPPHSPGSTSPCTSA